MDLIVTIILLLIGGCLAGFMAGLLGIGGGILITPIQYFLLVSNGIDQKIALTVTFATSLAVICVTMINSSYHHYKNGLVQTKNLKVMIIMGFVGAILGAIFSNFIDVTLLKIIFGVLCIASTILLVIIKPPADLSNVKEDKLSHSLLALSGGIMSGLMGPAGGAILIPIFIAYLKYPLQNTIGTTSALSISIAIGGIITYILMGWNVSGLPEFSIGYINLLQFIFLIITSILVSTYASLLTKRIEVRKLKILQVIVIGYIGLKMIGIF